MDVSPSGVMHLSYFVGVNFVVHGLLSCVLGLQECFEIVICLKVHDGYLNLSFFK